MYCTGTCNGITVVRYNFRQSTGIALGDLEICSFSYLCVIEVQPSQGFHGWQKDDPGHRLDILRSLRLFLLAKHEQDIAQHGCYLKTMKNEL